MLHKYYLSELAYLRTMGQEFAATYPEVAHLLAERSADPDVERLLEGFAFLTAKIREKLDDEFPEVIHSLCDLFFPEYLRPLAATALLQFTPLPGLLRERHRIPRGTEVASVPVEGTACRFRTTQDVDLVPLEIAEVSMATPKAAHAELRIGIRMQPGVKLGTVDLRNLRIQLVGPSAPPLYLALCRRVRGLRLRGAGANRELRLSPHAFRPGGLAEEEALFPTAPAAAPGFRLLHELYTQPGKFLSLDLVGLERASELGPLEAFELVVDLEEPLPGDVRLGPSSFALGCTPIVNIFQHEADPIALSHEQTEYRIRPAGADPRHYAVYSVERVTGLVQGSPERRTYEPLLRFGRTVSRRESGYYTARLRPAIAHEGSEMYIALSPPQGETTRIEEEAISIDLLCTNRRLPTQLRVGDVNVPTASTSPLVRFANLTVPTPPVDPPLGGDLHWRLLAHLHLAYRTLADVEALRELLDLYNFAALVDRQAARANQMRLKGIRSWRAVPCDRLMSGAPVRGIRFEAELDEEAFAGEGELLLFATLLNEILAGQAPLNSFHWLDVTTSRSRARYPFTPRMGDLPRGARA